MTAESIYQSLKDCYRQPNRSYLDRAKSLRSRWEKYVSAEMPNNVDRSPLGVKLSKYFDELKKNRKDINKNDIKKIQSLAHKLLSPLNTAVHDDLDCVVSPEDLQLYYRTLLIIIKTCAGVEPDEQSLILSGLKPVESMGLNLEQKNAVFDDSQVVIVNAGPGTGKTHLLVRKVIHYLQIDKNWKIVTLSFTNAAATQLKEKINDLAKKYLELNITLERCQAGTIHAFCFNALAKYYEKIGKQFDYEILDDSDFEPIATELASQWGCPLFENEIEDILRTGKCVNNNKLLDAVKAFLKEHHLIRVEEILDMFLETFGKNDASGEYLKGFVDCLLVDESQDLTSKIYNVIKLIFKENPQMKLFLVGDPRQNIFAFNGGSYKNFKDFITDLNIKSVEYSLTLTYRCPKAIVSIVNKLEFTDCDNPALIPQQTTINGKSIIMPFENEQSEALGILQIIKCCKSYSNVGILCSWLKYLEPVGLLLNQCGIPFVVKGGNRHLNPKIKIVNDCLRIISSANKNSIADLKRLDSNFEESEFHEWLLYKSKEKNKFDIFAVLSLVQDVVDHLCNETSLISEDDKPLLEKYIKAAAGYASISDFLFACSIHKNDDFADFYMLDFPVKSTASVGEQGTVTISTIHSAKGLEWKNVVVAGLYNGGLPTYKCYSRDQLSILDEKLYNDEKKKFYVAVTRSSENIFLTYPKRISTKFGTKPKDISPFIMEQDNSVVVKNPSLK